MFIVWLPASMNCCSVEYTCFCELQVASERSYAPRCCGGRLNHVRIDGRECDGTLSRAGDEHIEPTVTAFAVDAGEALEEIAPTIAAIRDRDEDYVSLVTLYIFEVLDKEGSGVPSRDSIQAFEKASLRSR